jgi:hypothetical protein
MGDDAVAACLWLQIAYDDGTTGKIIPAVTRLH